MTNKDLVIGLIKSQGSGVFIPEVFLRLAKGRYQSAVFLAQCVYWTDKMGRAFYKSYADWESDYYLSRYDIDKARSEFSEIVETELRKADGAPTLWYKINWDKLIDAITKLDDPLANGFATQQQMDLLPSDKSICDPVANPLTKNTTENTTDISTTGSETTKIFRTYESEIGILTSFIRDNIIDALELYPAEWIIEAIHEAALNNARNWRYVEAILKRWKADGFKSEKAKSAPSQTRRKSAGGLSPEAQAIVDDARMRGELV